MSKPIVVRGRTLGQGEAPLVCVPLVGATASAIREEARTMAALAQVGDASAPDLLEWRVDAFDGAADVVTLSGTAAALREMTGSLPLLVTLRAAREGGRDHFLDDAERAARLIALVDEGVADLADFETDADPAALHALRAVCRARVYRSCCRRTTSTARRRSTRW